MNVPPAAGTDSRHRVLVLDSGNEWGGGTNSLIELLKRVNRERYHFTVLFYRNYPKGKDSDIKTEIERLGIDFLLLDMPRPVLKNLIKESLRHLIFTKKMRESFFAWVDYNFRVRPNARKICGIIKELKIDLLYMNNQPSSNLEGIIASRQSGIKCLQHSRIETRLTPLEVDAVNDVVMRMICVSGGVMESFQRQGVRRDIMEVVYNGIDPNVKPNKVRNDVRRELGVEEDTVLIGSVGSLVGRKRFCDLVDAVAALKAKGKPVKGIVVGEGPERKNLESRIKNTGLGDFFLLPGFKQDPLSYLSAMDVFTLPSRREGFPRVILEAMLINLPVVACSVAGPLEQVVHGETGYLYDAGEVEGLSGFLSLLADSSDLRIRMGARSREVVLEKFSMQAYINGVERVFAEVLA